MDLSKDTDAVEEPCSASVESVPEAIESDVVCLDSAVTPAPASSDTSSQLEMILMPFDCTNETSDEYLGRADETPDELVSCASFSDPTSSQVEDVREVEQPEMLLKPAQIDAVCDSEESSEFSVAVVEDDNHRSVAEQSEAHVDDGAGLVRDSGEESQQLSVELGSHSQSPMSFVVQLNEDSECSLQSLPPGEHGPTNFSMKLSGLVSESESYITNVGHVTAAEYLEDDSRCSQYSERVNEEADLLMEVETGSAMSEAVSVQDSCTTLDPKSTSAASQKSSSRADDRNKSRIRKRLMVDAAPVETEDGFVTSTTISFSA